MAGNSKVLTSTGISCMITHIEDNRNRLSLIASSVVNVTVVSIFSGNCSFSSLPLHRQSMVITNRKLTDLSFDSIFVPVTKIGFMVNCIFEINQSAGNTSVNERHFVTRKVLDK
jgi:hypothetical protein